jgi:DNA-binding NarL/FixJ family response regulator
VLVLTSYTEPSTMVPALRAGAAGYLDKDVEPAALAAAIRAVHHGQVLLQPETAAALLAADNSPDGLNRLTPRELDVLRILTEGFSNQQIARRLFISESTVSVHVSHIIAKLGVSNRLQAAAAAQRLNLFPSEQHRV